MTETISIPLDQIRLNEYNPNSMDAETFSALVKDMEEGGPEAVDPILLRPLEEAMVVHVLPIVRGAASTPSRRAGSTSGGKIRGSPRRRSGPSSM